MDLLHVASLFYKFLKRLIRNSHALNSRPRTIPTHTILTRVNSNLSVPTRLNPENETFLFYYLFFYTFILSLLSLTFTIGRYFSNYLLLFVCLLIFIYFSFLCYFKFIGWELIWVVFNWVGIVRRLELSVSRFNTTLRVNITPIN